MASAMLVEQGPGRYAITGELGFTTVTELLHSSQSLLSNAQMQIDLSGVKHADSAGLSLLVEWLRLAKQQGRRLEYVALPAQLKALAGISEVETLFTA